MNGFEKRTQKKKSDIIFAAQKLFAQRGITEVSITEIAAAASVSRVTLFKYFGDKEMLAREAMSIWIETLLEEYKGVIDSNAPFSEKLMTLLSIRLVGRDRIGEQYIHTTAWNDPEMVAIVEQLTKKKAQPLVFAFIEEGKKTGYIESSLDSEAIIAYFSAFGPIVKNPAYANKGKNFYASMYNLFMGGLIKDWYKLCSEVEE